MTNFKKFIPKSLLTKIQPVYHFCLGFLAAVWYRQPSRQLIVIGVTGTAGKTSSVYLIAKALEATGYSVGYTSTAMFDDGRREWLNDKKMTMPGRFFVQKMLRRMIKNHCQYAVIETTSEGIKQYRHRFINYDILVFTGLYPEHIESHGSFDNYKQTKGRLFAHLKKCAPKYVNDRKVVCHPQSELKKLDLIKVKKTVVVNGDDEHSPYFLNFWSEEQLIYTNNSEFDCNLFMQVAGEDKILKDCRVYFYNEIITSAAGTSFKLDGQTINLQLLGVFNVKNALNATLVAYSQGLSFEQIKTGLENVTCLSGKMERINNDYGFEIIVDYSFEPVAVTKLYETLNLLPHRRIIHILGSCGGGRDQSRRPILGKIAGERADYVIVTNEDPYDEDPLLIIDQVAAGALNSGKIIGETLFKEADRRQAITLALKLAEPGDIVVMTGKGAEQYICIAGGQKIPWDERRIVREELANLKKD